MSKIKLLLFIGFFVLLFSAACNSDDDELNPLDAQGIVEDPVDDNTPVQKQFQLLVIVTPEDSGLINISEGSFDEGSAIQLEGTPNSVYKFKEWQGDITGTGNPVTIVMDKEKTITAVFELNKDLLTYVPDDNFESALIEFGYDDVMDDYVLTSAISDVSSLALENRAISDLMGIEGFIGLTRLGLYNNEIASIDLTGNTELTTLDCRSNQLTDLNLSKNPKLESLSVSFNQLNFLNLTQNTLLKYVRANSNRLTEIDLSENSLIEELDLYDNQLTSLDLTQNTLLRRGFFQINQLNKVDLSQNNLLEWLLISNNQLTEIDLTHNTSLKDLNISDNQITELELSNNVNLFSFSCSNNKITSLDLSQNSKLSALHCSYNQLTVLDISSVPYLNILSCNNNQLTSLNLKNGNNNALRGYGFIDPPPPPHLIYIGLDATNNPLLNCIQVDDVDKVNSGVPPYRDWKKDDSASYEENCE